jgi:hypothetical protein
MTGPRPFKKFIFKDYFRDPIEKFSGIINLSQNEIFINIFFVPDLNHSVLFVNLQ